VATFWIIATLLILLAFAFVIPPLLRKAFTPSEIDQTKMNLAIYKERLAELTQENLSSEQFAQAKQELDKILAQDLPDQPELV
jgi:cytochrome c-type biogenesis protein CcmH